MKYLSDSDWVINCLRNVEPFVRQLTELRPEGIALSIISVAEIYKGMYRRRNPVQEEKRFREFLGGDITTLPLSDEICHIFAREEVRLRGRGTPIGDMDLFIAATALQRGLILLTNNIQHFRRVEGLEIISIQQNEES